MNPRLLSIHTYPVKGCRRRDHDETRVLPWGLTGDRRWMVVDGAGVGITQRDTSALVALEATARAGELLLRAAGRAPLAVPEPRDGDVIDVRVFTGRPTVPARCAGPAADRWLSALLDRDVRLVWLGDPSRHVITNPVFGSATGGVSFADEYPLLVANAASLDALNGWLLEAGSVEAPLPMTRFRPNLVVGGYEPWAEDDWLGHRLRIGSVTFRVGGACGRCVVTTIDQETGRKGDEPLRVLGRYRNVDQQLRFGLHLVPEEVGGGTDGVRVAVGDPVAALP